MKWISVKKSTPNTPREVLCVDAIGYYFIGYYTEDSFPAFCIRNANQ